MQDQMSSAHSPRYSEGTGLLAACIASSTIRRSLSFYRARGILTSRNVHFKNRGILERSVY